LNGAVLRDTGYDVIAADRSAIALEGCRKAGLQTIDLTCESLPAEGADAILAGDIIEHVEEDGAILRDLRTALRPGGVLLVTVPAYEFLWSGEDFVSGHVRRYTRRSLNRLLVGSGFDVVWSSYYNTVLFPVVAAVIFLTRVFRPREMYTSNIKALPDPVNSLLARIFAAERLALRKLVFPFGASIIAVARKPADARAEGRSDANHR
jgi:SAM-dependent methyltransferase